MSHRRLARRLVVALSTLGVLALWPAGGVFDREGARLAVAVAAPPNGGAEAGTPAERDRGRAGSRSRRRERSGRRRRARGRPVLRSYAVAPGRAYLYGRPARVSFRIADRSRRVRVRLDVLAPGRRRVVRRIDLGHRRTGVAQSHSIAGRAGGPLPEGRLELRLTARDSGGRRLRARSRGGNTRPLSFHWHRFPLRGRFGLGGAGSRFGAGRPDHVHQGQDIAAPTGTPVVAPRGGRVRVVAVQATGAGHYVVLGGAGEDREYAFMHLLGGSVRVRPGQYVRTGQRLAGVGSTGVATGPHLHFEIWQGGPWQGGGRPIDPLPYLRRWASWSR
jgi:hypothetical protein